MAIKKTDYELTLGRLVCTIGIDRRMDEDRAFHKFIFQCLGRYMNNDWGDTCDEDKDTTLEALKNGERILAVYIFRKTQEAVWIITEADRSVTTILFPDEY